MHDGKRHQIRLGRKLSRTVARELAAVKRAAILKGESGIGGRKRKDLPFQDAAEIFLTWVRTNKRPHTARSYGGCVEQLKESFAGRRLGEIHAFLIEKHKQRRKDVPVAANREVTVLKALFNKCIDWGKFDGVNPVRKIQFFEESKGRDRFLEPEEEASLLAQCAEPLRTIVMAGIYAGLRIPSETLRLRWEDVDLKRGRLTVQGAYAKTGQTRTIPLNSKLRGALEALKARSRSEYVFAKEDGTPYRTVQNIFRSACRRAELIGVSPHVMRHTFASRLGMVGVDIRTIQELGGWAEIKMVERYANLSTSHKAEAIEKLSNAPVRMDTVLATERVAKPVS